MGIALSSRDLTGIESVLRTLLAPMDHPDVTSWRRRVACEVRALTRVDSVSFFMRCSGAPLLVVDGDHHPKAIDDYAAHYYRQVVGEDVRIKRKLPVWTREELWPWESFRKSEYYNDFCIPNALEDSAGMSVRISESDESLLYIHSAKARQFTHMNREIAILRLLRPAFAAGVRAVRQPGALSLGVRVLDALPDAIGLFDVRGRLVHATTAYVRLSEDPTLNPPISMAAYRMVQDAATGTLCRPGKEYAAATSIVRGSRATYRIHLAQVEHSTPGGELLYVASVTQLSPPPDAASLIARFHLTRREAEVALRVAAGERNQAIANSLGTSVHTVRRQVERVLAKTGVQTRAAAAAKFNDR